jgi:hypothetical protein
VEADDYWIDPYKLQNQVNFLETHQTFSMCFTATKHIYPRTSKKPRLKRYRNTDCVCSPKDVIIRGGSLLDMISAVARRTVFDNIPDWYYFRHLWDVSIPLLSLLHGNIQYHNDVTSVYRVNAPGSWTQNTANNYVKRKVNIINSIRLTNGFDKYTDYKFHNHVEKKANALIVGLLLLANDDDNYFKDYYNSLPYTKKLEYSAFKLFGSFRLWDKFRQIIRFFKVIFFV